MKTKTQKIKRGLALWVLVFSAIFITLNMNACGSKDNGGGGGGGPGPAPTNCPTCVGGAANLGAALGQNNEIGLGLSFTTGGQAPAGGSGSYTGPVTASGFLQIKTPFQCAIGVQLPPGLYGVNTVTPGQWMGAWGSSMVRGLVMTANGIQIVVGPGSGYPDGIINGVSPYRVGPQGEQYPSYLAGSVLIQSVNGQPCNMFGPLVESIN